MDGDNPHSSFERLAQGLRRILQRRRVSSEKELQDLIDESEAQGIINEEEGEMLHSIFEFGDTVVREIMVPRTDMVCCSCEASLREALSAIISSGHSRIPVYEGTIDRIVGVIYAKDLLNYWGEDAAGTDVRDVMREPYFVPEAKKIIDLLQEFRTKRVHIAIAIDEYGGTSGLVTIEDLLEEIVGEIQDEYDVEEAMLVEEEDGGILVDARINIEEVEEYFDIEITRDKFDTVGGYLFHLLNHVPVAGEAVVSGPLHMTVVDCDERKINKVRIIRRQAESAHEAIREEGHDA